MKSKTSISTFELEKDVRSNQQLHFNLDIDFGSVTHYSILPTFEFFIAKTHVDSTCIVVITSDLFDLIVAVVTSIAFIEQD
jgi:hypothetical protein